MKQAFAGMKNIDEALGACVRAGSSGVYQTQVRVDCVLKRLVIGSDSPVDLAVVGVKKDANWFAQLAFVALHAEAGVNNDHSEETRLFRAWLEAQKIDRSKYAEQWVFDLVRSWRLSRAAYNP